MEYINIKKLIDIIRKEHRQHANTKERVANVLDEILKFTYDKYQVKGDYVTNNELLEYLNGKVNTDGSNIEDIEAWQLILDFYSKNESDLRYKSIDYIPSWTEISGKPSSFNPSAHNHSISDINGLNEQIDLILTDIDIINEDYVNLQQEVDEIVQDLEGKEDKTNKQDSLTTDGTGTKYPTVDAVNNGLNSKISGDGIINRIPKYIDEKVIGFSNITDNGTSVDIDTTSSPNSSKLIFKTTGSGSFIDSYHFISDTYNDIIINQLGGNLGIGKAPSTTEKLDVNGNVKSNSYKFTLPTSITAQPNMLIPKVDGSRPMWYDNSSIGNDLAFSSEVNAKLDKPQNLSNNTMPIWNASYGNFSNTNMTYVNGKYGINVYGEPSESFEINGGNVKASLFKDQYGTLRSQRVITVTGNITLSEIHNGAILHITNTCSITIPTGLGTNFSCDCYVKGAFIATFVNGGVTLNSPSGLLLKTDKMATLYSNASDTFNLLGELVTS